MYKSEPVLELSSKDEAVTAQVCVCYSTVQTVHGPDCSPLRGEAFTACLAFCVYFKKSDPLPDSIIQTAAVPAEVCVCA